MDNPNADVLANVKVPKKKLGRRKTIELSDPIVENKLEQAINTGKTVAKRDNITSIRSLLKTPEIKEAFEDIINMSAMSPAQKIWLKSVFIDQEPQKKAIEKAFGKDLGYQEEIISHAILSQKQIQEFADLMRSFYVKASPIAFLKEIDIMMNPLNDPKVQLAAAKDIQDRALPQSSGKSGALPVSIVINMPGSKNVQQINNNE